MIDICLTCGAKAHDYSREEFLSCVPPEGTLTFGPYQIDPNYRRALYAYAPMYTSEEVVGTYLGNNPSFPKQSTWLDDTE